MHTLKVTLQKANHIDEAPEFSVIMPPADCMMQETHKKPSVRSFGRLLAQTLIS